MQKSNRAFHFITLGCACFGALITAGLFFQLIWASVDAWKTFGIGFLFSTQWDPVRELYGALPSVLGTLLSAALALLLAVPPAFVMALFLTDMPPKIGRTLGYAVDMLAAIPSVIYGMWGLFVLAPWMQHTVQPFLAETLHLQDVAFFGPVGNGFGFLTAGLILALMILPYMCAVMRDVMHMMPNVLKEAAFGMGCTRWEYAKDVLMRYGSRGFIGAVFIGLGRALGETMAVLFIIGNVMHVPDSLFANGTTIAATLANAFGEAQGLQRSALFALGVILLVISFLIQCAAQFYLKWDAAKAGGRS